MKKSILFILAMACLLIIFAVSGCASKKESAPTMPPQQSSSGNAVKNTGAVYELDKLQNTKNFKPGALEHILKGAKSHGVVSGYHYEGMPNSNAKAIAGTASAPNRYGVYTAQVAEKKGDGGRSTFFPKSMTPQQIVDSINEAYVTKTFRSGNVYRGTAASGMVIEMYLDQNKQIISAFPIY